MSIFFIGQRRAATPPLPPPDLDAALAAAAQNGSVNAVAGAGNLQPGQAESLLNECRKIEPMLIDEIASDRITTKTGAIQFVADNTQGPFPAGRFVQQMIDNAGGTVAKLVTECKKEVSSW